MYGVFRKAGLYGVFRDASETQRVVSSDRLHSKPSWAPASAWLILKRLFPLSRLPHRETTAKGNCKASQFLPWVCWQGDASGLDLKVNLVYSSRVYTGRFHFQFYPNPFPASTRLTFHLRQKKTGYSSSHVHFATDRSISTAPMQTPSALGFHAHSLCTA